MFDTEFLIVGGGIAGSLLSWHLRESNLRVLNGPFPSASLVAAGVLNPVTGRRLAKVPDFNVFWEAAVKTYDSLPSEKPVLRKTSIRRFFRNTEESARFEERKNLIEFNDYLGPPSAPSESGLPVRDELGSFTIRESGIADLPQALTAIQTALPGVFVKENADWNSFHVDEGGISLNGIRSKTLICCEGASAVTNPLFRWLPFRPVGGETLTVHMREVPDFSEVIQHGKWILSLGSNRFRIGSTYEKIDLGGEGLRASRNLPTPTTSLKAKEELAESLRGIFPDSEEPVILEHRAGLRPASRDRFPYLGPHPQHKNIFLCNGLGSKGALFAPC